MTLLKLIELKESGNYNAEELLGKSIDITDGIFTLVTDIFIDNNMYTYDQRNNLCDKFMTGFKSNVVDKIKECRCPLLSEMNWYNEHHWNRPKFQDSFTHWVTSDEDNNNNCVSTYDNVFDHYDENEKLLVVAVIKI